MDLRQLRYFVASAEEGHMGRAAARLFVAQSALSRQVKALEREIGVPLFHRTPRGVTLTEVGETFLPLARRTLAAAADALREARAAAGIDSGRLRVAPPEVGPWTRRVAEGLERFRGMYPDVRVELVAIPWAEHGVALREDFIDVGFAVATDVADHPPDLAASVLARDRLRTALLPADHPLARRRTISLDDLAGMPMVLSDRDAIGSLYDAVLTALHRAGYSAPSVVAAPASFAAVTQLVAGGAGWAAVLDLVREGPPPGTVARRLRGVEATLELHLLRLAARRDETLEALEQTLVSGGSAGPTDASSVDQRSARRMPTV